MGPILPSGGGRTRKCGPHGGDSTCQDLPPSFVEKRWATNAHTPAEHEGSAATDQPDVAETKTADHTEEPSRPRGRMGRSTPIRATGMASRPERRWQRLSPAERSSYSTRGR
jgi:hypothetical protein